MSEIFSTKKKIHVSKNIKSIRKYISKLYSWARSRYLRADAESKRFAPLRQVDAKHLRVEFNQNNIFKRLRGNENCFHNISRKILPTVKKPDEWSALLNEHLLRDSQNASKNKSLASFRFETTCLDVLDCDKARARNDSHQSKICDFSQSEECWKEVFCDSLHVWRGVISFFHKNVKMQMFAQFAYFFKKSIDHQNINLFQI